jgi:hypothetical protein
VASGDHLYVRRGLRYSHHGIDCGDGTVIHHIGPRRSLLVARTSLEEFAVRSKVRVRTYGDRLSAEDAIRNAESRLGSSDYSLVRNNCEHFAAWCCTGRARSAQVRRWVLGLQGAVVTFVAAQSIGAPLALAGTAGAGFVALLRPLRRRRRRIRARLGSPLVATESPVTASSAQLSN